MVQTSLVAHGSIRRQARSRFVNTPKPGELPKRDVADRTRINVDGRLNNHSVPFLGDMQMSAVRPTDVRAFVAHLTASGKAPSTVKAIFHTTAQVFRQAVQDDVIAKTPCLGISLPRERRQTMDFISPEQVNDLAEIIDDRYKALIYTAAYAGLPAGNLSHSESGT